MRDSEFLTNPVAASDEMSRATEELRQACGTILTQSKELVNMIQLKDSIKDLEENISFHEDSKESLKGMIARLMAEITWIGALFDSTRAQMIELKERMTSKDAMMKSVAHASCATLWPFIKSMFEKFS